MPVFHGWDPSIAIRKKWTLNKMFLISPLITSPKRPRILANFFSREKSLLQFYFSNHSFLYKFIRSEKSDKDLSFRAIWRTVNNQSMITFFSSWSITLVEGCPFCLDWEEELFIWLLLKIVAILNVTFITLSSVSTLTLKSLLQLFSLKFFWYSSFLFFFEGGLLYSYWK